MEQINENIWVLKHSKAIVSFQSSSTTTPTVHPNTGKIVSITYGKEKNKVAKIMHWGSRNLLPQEREKLISENNIIPELLGTKRDILVAGGIYCYNERIQEEKGKQTVVRDAIETPAEIQAFFDKIQVNKYLRSSCKNLMVHANTFTEMTCLAGGAIDMIKAHECRHTRAEEQDENGDIPNYYVCGKWQKLSDKDATISQVPTYNPSKEFQAKFMYHTGDDLLYDDYYFIPRWWGGKDWIILSNRVPVFHIRNLDNGYLIRWHIEIPKDYFRDYTAAMQSPGDIETTKVKETEARKKFLKKLNEFLAGEDGAGRAVITEYEINRQLGKDFPGIKITALNVDIKDKALLDVFDKSNDANISGQGVPPALASIQTPGKLGSGSETRNSFNVWLATKAPIPRDILLEPLYIVAKKNGWDPKVKFGFRDIELTALDENKAGKQDTTAV